MRRDSIERWLPALGLIVVCAVLVFEAYAASAMVSVAVAPVVLVLLVGAWWVSPLHRGRHIDHARAQAQADDDDLIIYWKPGCRYCIELLARLDRAARDQAMWVNVWQDDAAANFVADHNDGNVLTPTVMTGSGRRLPRTVDAARSFLAEHGTR